MLFRRASLCALLALAACDDHDVIVDPPADEARPVLAAGTYQMRIVDVAELACEGMSRGELVGQSVSAELAVRGDAVTFAFGGWVLRGDMADGNLYVEGTVEDVVVEHDDDDTDTDVDTGEDEDGVVSEEDDREAACADAPEDTEDRDDREDREDREDEGDSPPPGDGFVSLDARILAIDQADGRLSFSLPGCEMDLAVVLERGEEEPPVYEEDEPREDEPESGGSDEEAVPAEG